ncbi:MAG TPA: trypsin-like peptidase domain-containing protein [Microbacteriaceae bacterium]|nr:trypsin-like peptidase domain-containing protein [Microbacteriaceae bacterium]
MNDIENVQPEPQDTPVPQETPPSPAYQEPIRVYVPAQEPPRRRSWLPVVGGLVAGAVFGAAAGGIGGFVVAQNASGSGQAGASPTSPQTITVNDLDDVNVITAVAASAIDSVVTLAVSAEGVGSGTGSGVVLNSDGYIVTNTHVVTLGGATADPVIRVTTSAGRVYDAKLIGTDPLLDLAVIQVEGASELVPIEFADSSELNVGDVTIAIGSPLGYAGTVTSGIVSAIDRSIQVQSSAAPEEDSTASDGGGSENPFDNFRFDLPGVTTTPSRGTIQIPVVQTDTAINPGNSGGALLDASGRLIGINVAIAGSTGGNVGVGFAIPSNVVARISSELIENGVATHGLLGVTVVNVASDPAQADADIIGASIQSVVDGSGAAEAGLKIGDIIVSFDGIPITSRNDLTAQVRTRAIGDVVDVVYVRGGQSHTVSVTLGDLNTLPQ